VKLTNHLHLGARLITRRALPPLLNISACRAAFTVDIQHKTFSDVLTNSNVINVGKLETALLYKFSHKQHLKVALLDRQTSSRETFLSGGT
jgi:hypothetical protein